MRARDALGRPVAAGSPDAVEPPVVQSRTAAEALTAARALLAANRPFFAHEVLEEQWKSAPAAQRPFWRGLAQLAVGLTHLQRGNRTGAARLLRRGAGVLAELGGPEQASAALRGAGRDDPGAVDLTRLVHDALELAAAIDTGGPTGPLAL